MRGFSSRFRHRELRDRKSKSPPCLCTERRDKDGATASIMIRKSWPALKSCKLRVDRQSLQNGSHHEDSHPCARPSCSARHVGAATAGQFSSSRPSGRKVVDGGHHCRPAHQTRPRCRVGGGWPSLSESPYARLPRPCLCVLCRDRACPELAKGAGILTSYHLRGGCDAASSRRRFHLAAHSLIRIGIPHPPIERTFSSEKPATGKAEFESRQPLQRRRQPTRE